MSRGTETTMHPLDRPKTKTLLVTRSVRERKRTSASKRDRMKIVLLSLAVFMLFLLALVQLGTRFASTGPRGGP